MKISQPSFALWVVRHFSSSKTLTSGIMRTNLERWIIGHEIGDAEGGVVILTNEKCPWDINFEKVDTYFYNKLQPNIWNPRGNAWILDPFLDIRWDTKANPIRTLSSLPDAFEVVHVANFFPSKISNSFALKVVVVAQTAANFWAHSKACIVYASNNPLHGEQRTLLLSPADKKYASHFGDERVV